MRPVVPAIVEDAAGVAFRVVILPRPQRPQERRKPDPMPLVETARMLGCEPVQVLMIGDSANDSQAAHGAGCPVVLVRYGYNHGEPVDRVPALGYLERLSDLHCAE